MQTTRRLFAPMEVIAREEGIPVELLGFPDSGLPRVPIEQLAATADRLELALGGPDALAEAAASPAVWAGFSVLATASESPRALAEELVQRTLRDDVTALETSLADVGPDAFEVTVESAAPDAMGSGFPSLLAGLFQCLPLFYEATPADVQWERTPRGYRYLVTVPPRESSAGLSVSAHLGQEATVNAVVAMLEDRSLYQVQRARLHRLSRTLADVLARPGSSEECAVALLAWLSEGISLNHALLWAGPSPRERRRLASVGRRTSIGRVIALSVGSGPVAGTVGMLEIDTDDDASFVDALVPWIAGELRRRQEKERKSTPIHSEFPEDWGLSPRQKAVASLVVAGLANKEIALALGCSTGTVEDHLTAIYRKSQLAGRGALLAALWSHPEPNSVR
jgi:DNA-binding CsgD family transcriptional regulator